MRVKFENTVNIIMVIGEHWYEHNVEVILGSIGQSEDDSYYYFTPSGHPIEVRQLRLIADKVYELNYAEFIEPLNYPPEQS
jgi:hypothetical protein